MRKLRLVLSIALCIMLLLQTTVVVAVEETSTCVALGDSIVTGYGLENFNLNDTKNISSSKNFVNKLGKKLNKKAVNLGVEGINSTVLLASIANPATSAQKTAIKSIRGADVIVISIGGNNVFIPILNAVNDKIKNGKNIFQASALEIQFAALRLINDKTALNKLQNTVLANAANFIGDTGKNRKGELESIISKVKEQNPKAQIIVLTVYNPYKVILPDVFNNTIDMMNSAIIEGSEEGKNYKVADVSSAFEKANGSVLVNSASGNLFDPHPNAKGHEVIYTLVSYEAQNGTLPYKIRPIIRNGRLSTKISAGEFIMEIIPVKGYKAPEYISLTIGKGERKTLPLIKGIAKVPIADINDKIVVTGVCKE